MEKIIGLDIGSTNIKGEIYSRDGRLIDSLNYPYKTYIKAGGQIEQDSTDWINFSVRILNTFLEKYRDIKAVGLSTQGGTLQLVNSDYRPIRNAIYHLDMRADDEKENILSEIDEDTFYGIVGWRILAIHPILKLLWLKKHERSNYNKLYRIMFASDYVQMKLSGKCYLDHTNASISSLFDIVDKKWSGPLLKLAGIDESMLSEPRRSVDIVGYLQNEKLEKKSTKVLLANSAHDQYCSSISAGIHNDKRILLSTGTAWIVFISTNKPKFNKFFYAPGIHIVPNKYGLICSIPSGGGVINWFLETYFDSRKNADGFLQYINENHEDILKLKNSCLFSPLFTGVYGPVWSDNVRGSFLNLDLSMTKTDLFIAVLEGVGYQFRWILESLRSIGIYRSGIIMVGGAVKSKIWPQIIADITGTDVIIPKEENINYAAKGAAILAGVACGTYKDFDKADKIFKDSEAIIKPRTELKDYFDAKYELYIKALKSINDL